jgi:SAM-dependent methyltransferase
MPRLDDAAFVREQYASEENLAARKAAYATAEGPDAREVLFAAIAEAEPARVLEVGGGEGELAERIVRELGTDLVGLDQSERMVEIQRAKGIDARVGDVQELPFADADFDVAVAAWMLYHVPDLDRALAELARVLRPGGRLVAVTNSVEHLRELHELAGRDPSERDFTFRRENGEELLLRHFARVERRDADGWVTFDDASLRSYAASWESPLRRILDLPPLERPLRARRASTIFVAEKT